MCTRNKIETAFVNSEIKLEARVAVMTVTAGLTLALQ
jgi:hypothetical protein